MSCFYLDARKASLKRLYMSVLRWIVEFVGSLMVKCSLKGNGKPKEVKSS